MPWAPLLGCKAPGCPELVRMGSRCARHRRADEQQRGTSAQRGYGAAWQRRRARFLARNPFCVVCGDLATEVDHIIRRRDGGPDDESNLQPLCKRHHSQKTIRESRRLG